MKKFNGFLPVMFVVALLFTACSSTKEMKKDDTAKLNEEMTVKTVVKSEDKEAVKEESGNSEGAPGVIALVNGEKVFKRDLDNIMNKYSGMELNKAELADVRKKVLGQIIDGELLYQESKQYPVMGLDDIVKKELANLKDKFDSEEDFNKELEKNNLTEEIVKVNVKKQVIVRNFVNEQIVSKIKVTDEEARKIYDENLDKYGVPEQVKASHILIRVTKDATDEQKMEAMDRIKKIKERLGSGEDFGEVAKEVSECPSAKKGGDLGYFGIGAMVKPFEDAAFSTPSGEISDVVTTKFGYHLIKVYDKKKAEVESFDVLKDIIIDGIRKERYQEKLIEIVNNLKTNAKIEIFEDK